MPKPTLPAEGGCRCGKVRFRITAPVLLTMACHCTGCQKMTASAFSLSAAVPEAGFEIVQGEPEIGGLHGPQVLHHHCGWCKSWLFSKLEGADFVNVRATLLDEVGWFEPYMESFTSEKLGWAVTGAVRSYPRFPEFADFPGLIAEYQAKG